MDVKITAVTAILLCVGCAVPIQVRDAVKQADYEVAKAGELLSGEAPDIAGAQIRIPRARNLLGEVSKAYPSELEPTDSTYTTTLAKMEELRQQVEQLRALMASIKSLVSAPMSIDGAGVGGILGGGFLLVALRYLLRSKALSQLFTTVTGQIAQQQSRTPGSMDALLTGIKDKATSAGVYNTLEKELAKKDTCTTRSSAPVELAGKS